MGGQCACICQQRYPMGTLVVYDRYIGTVIAGHQTAVSK